MSDIWAFVMSPTGIAVYALFWAIKLTLGVWFLRRLVMILPFALREWLAQRFKFLGLGTADLPGPWDFK